ncbi:tetratricopeptide repeat protein [Propionivibrio sp.]|uniref:tetratricopeptide repeat protein n=1 Tax=Propionivibrio sp. TaxID=2212460 RepID=UPI0025F4C96E|nr:tetratricopeptide repeat protein [Propionivibrio sp.]
MTQSTTTRRDPIEHSKDSMKSIQHTLCIAVLSLVLSVPSLAADKAAPSRKRAPATRDAKHAQTTEPLPGDAQLTDQVVYRVLLAEIALQRGDVNLASKIYSDLALLTRDPKILERTIEVAGHARRFDLALTAARLWLEVEPGSKRAQQILISAMILSNQLADLAPSLVRLLEKDQASLGENLLGLNRMFAQNPDRQAVFHLIDETCRPFIGLAEAHYAVAMAAGSAGENGRALSEIRRALELRPDWELAALLEAQILTRQSPSEAISSLQRFIAQYPKASDVKLSLARALIGEKRYAEAKHLFDELLVDYPDKPEIVYPAAILALQQNESALAETRFKHLVTLGIPDKSLAYYYLGQIAEADKRSAEALSYYAMVGAGEQFIPAHLRSARLLAEQGQLDLARVQLREVKGATPEDRIQLLIAEAGLLREAKQEQKAYNVLDEALTAQPEQADLLYETALLAEKLGLTDILESRLRKLIELRPESAQAYNALGYSYADRNIRLTEALALIAKALKLAPEDPFILDSMGWVLYRQGDLAAALTYLEQAYARRDDPEVAAHMGEVLWKLGRIDEAQRTMREALKKHPANEALATAIKKFAP